MSPFGSSQVIKSQQVPCSSRTCYYSGSGILHIDAAPRTIEIILRDRKPDIARHNLLKDGAELLSGKGNIGHVEGKVQMKHLLSLSERGYRCLL